MNPSKIKLILFFVLFSSALFSQTTFQKIYSSDSIDGGLYIDESPQGEFYIGGFTNYSDPSYWDFFIMKVNSNGDTLWTRILGEVNHVEWPVEMRATSDGGVITIFNTDTLPYDVVLLKLDSNGFVSWTKNIGPDVSAYDLVQTTDSGFALIYFSLNYFGIMKTDPAGNVLWISSHVNNLTTYIADKISLIGTIDNGFAISTTTDQFDVALVKTDSLGIVQWTKIYSTPWMDHSFDLIQANDSGYVILCSMQNTPYSKELIIKTNSFGDTVWTKAYSSTATGNEDAAPGIFQTTDGGYYFSGLTYVGSSINKISLARINSNGNLLWAKRYGGIHDDWPNNILRTTDDGILITGVSVSYCSNSNSNIYLIKTDSIGFSGCNETNYPLAVQHPNLSIANLSINSCAPILLSNQQPYFLNQNQFFSVFTECSYEGISENMKLSDCNVFPNPSSSAVTFELYAFFNPQKCILILTNILGENVKSIRVENSKTIIQKENLGSGIYFYQFISDGNTIATGKIIFN